MLSIPCDHPDLEEFIEIKSDLDKVTKANISIRITDKFMEAVETGNTFLLSYTREETGETIEKEVDAAKLFHKICEMNWDYAEPGMLFWDNIENWNLLSADKEFKYAGTNPCFDGSMELLTAEGYKTFESLCGTEPYIYNVNGNVVKSKVWCSGEKETVKVKTGVGEIICTPDHRFMTIDGDECLAKDLKGKYIMPCHMVNKVFDKRFVKYGFIQGDGQLKNLGSRWKGYIEVNIGKRDTDIYDLFADDKYAVKSDRAINLEDYEEDLVNLGFSGENLPDRVFPSTYPTWSAIQKASFLHGCYSANGSVIKNGRISYKTTCKKFAEQLAETLLNDFNIKGVYITTNKPKTILFPNGEYECRESYDVNIGQYKEITKFISEINFYQHYKREQLAQMIKNRPIYVSTVIPYEKRKVYDFTEPERHWGIVEGYVVHNCAEEPLPAGGSCLLGSINLSEFVTKDKKFNYEDFCDTVKVAVEALNDVLEEGLPLHPLKEQRDSVRNWRQIGLGIMGLADMLIKLEIPYGSKKSLELCDIIGSEMTNMAIYTSALLAKESEPYPKFDLDSIELSEFYLTNTTKITKDLVSTYGLRNSQLITIAPTGTLSSMLGISGGIEPVFANYYTRKTESLHGHDEYYKVYTPIVKEYMESHGLTDDKDLPEYFVTAQNLDYIQRIDMQSVWQNHIDASISSTVNVPNSFSVEEVKDLYLYAWRSGLKGVTIFRDGCKRTGILTTGETKEESVPTKLERGMIIKADDNCVGRKRTLRTGCGTLHCEAFFDPVTGDLLETYFSKGSEGGCHAFMTGLSRMISLSARGGVDIYSIVDQLRSSGTCPSYAVRKATKHDTSKGSSCPVAIGNALLDMYEEINRDLVEDDTNEKVVIEEEIKQPTAKCPQCGGELVFEGGCNTCHSCGWSKCD